MVIIMDIKKKLKEFSDKEKEIAENDKIAVKKQHAKGKLSAFDKDEVIVTKIANELYDDIDFDEAKEAAAIKGKSIVSKKTRRRRNVT